MRYEMDAFMYDFRRDYEPVTFQTVMNASTPFHNIRDTMEILQSHYKLLLRTVVGAGFSHVI
jgi:hypothetical protein